MFSTLVALQLYTRLATFALNTTLAHTLTPAYYAFANVHLHLIHATALFLPKEGLRRAAQRLYPGGNNEALAHAVNLAWLAPPLAALAAIPLAALASRPDPAYAALMETREYAVAVASVCVAAVLEACAEPAWLYAQVNGMIHRRALAEGVALALRAAVTAWLALRPGGRPAYAFSAAALAYAVAYLILLYGSLWAAAVPLRLLLPRRAPAAAAADDDESARDAPCYLPSAKRRLSLQVTGQAAQKYLLTEGERLVLVLSAPVDAQGVFALVSNLGSLVARIFFAPLEEASFAHFSREKAAAAPHDAASPAARATRRSLGALLRAVALFAALAVSYGPTYGRLLVRLLYGTTWADGPAPALFSTYCVAIAAMALNGLAEAYVQATASRAQLARFSMLSIVFTAVYVLASIAGARTLGTHGIVLANSLNLGLRAAVCLAHIRREATSVGDADVRLSPHRLLLATVVASALGARAAGELLGVWHSTATWRAHVAHVLVGILGLATVASSALWCEPDLRAYLRSFISRKSQLKVD